MTVLEEFLAGDRPDDVAIFLAERTLDESDRLRELGEPVEGGVVIVVDGDSGREAFAAATGVGAMEFAGAAMDREGTVAGRLNAGECPDAADAAEDEDGEDAHGIEFALAFAEERNQAVGGRYAEGDVIHAYARCACGTAYSDRWHVGDRS